MVTINSAQGETFSNNQTKLCIYSYNSRGFSAEKQNFCYKLFDNTGDYLPILCNQENFLYKSCRYKVQQALPNAFIYFKEAHKKLGLSGGRPQNGMFIAIDKSLKNLTTNISPQRWRVQAIKIKFEDTSLLIVNTYFPSDDQTLNFDAYVLNEVLEEISAIIMNHSFDHLLLVGDLNTDFLRRSGHVQVVSDFVSNLSLIWSWDKFHADFSHVHEINGVTSWSLIDHFVWKTTLNNQVGECGSLHLVDNNSDHCPIFCKLTINCAHAGPTKPDFPPLSSKPSWKLASADEREFFVNILDDNLEMIEPPAFSCEDVHCKKSYPY